MIIFWPLVLAAIIILSPFLLSFCGGYIAYTYGIYSNNKNNISFKEYLKKSFKEDIL